jgi:multidrug efflux pump subunit AcrB/ABC-type multidrug transport system ATPase subunit
MNPFSLPVRRPVATAMFFLGIFLLGAVAWQRIPVELLPAVSGEELFVRFNRPGSEPDVVEREILLPIEARVRELSGVEETFAEVRGSRGSFQVRFASGTDLKVRELELRRVASELVRTQPRGTSIEVDSRDLEAMSRFVMFVQVIGMEDRNSLLDFINEQITPRLASVAGVSQVRAGGGAPREMTVRIDPDRCAALGVAPAQVTAALARTVRRLAFLGGAEDEAGRTAVVLDGRPRGVVSLAETRIVPNRPVLLRHVADVDFGTGREEMLFRINSEPTVAMVIFQEEDANLIRLGRALRAKMDELREEFSPYGLDFIINIDSAEMVEDQLNRLKKLAVSGFLIALAVLFLFLRQWRAVAVVAVAVPASLLTALALLLVFGQSINLITLFGLAVGIGMLVDNSIVVYEATQRRLEHGASPDVAAEDGVRRTVRAILAASLTTCIVYLPIAFVDFESAIARALLEVLALSILLPLAASVLVAVGLVPLLAQRLAAPAALARLMKIRDRRRLQGGVLPPYRPRELFGGFLMVALRRPGGWVTGVIAAVLITLFFAIPWVAIGTITREPEEAVEIRFSVDIETGETLESATGAFERLELAVMALDGVRMVESVVTETGGTLTVHLLPKEDRPEEVDAGRIRKTVRAEAGGLRGVEVDTERTGFGGGGRRGGASSLAAMFGQAPAEVVLSGPESRELKALAQEIEEQLESIPEISGAWRGERSGQDELRVTPDERALAAFGLTADQVLPALNVVRREGVMMQTGFTMYDGREVPMTVRREEDSLGLAGEDLRNLRLAMPMGVVSLGSMASVSKMPPPPTIVHHNGRREVSVYYRFGSSAPSTGPARQALEEEVREAIQAVHRTPGYTLEAPQAAESFGWFKKIILPVLLLLFAILAVAFESLTLPLLVMLALPLTVLGATWALVFSGTPVDWMATVGVLSLIGVTVNPAILLVDRMQTRAWRGGRPPGAAALAAVRERTRPVLMTAATTVAGLWPLALVTGQDNEIWPPFATVMMGGLITSTLLTLMVIPVGFVFLHRLDRLFGRIGPWIVIAWGAATTAIMWPLIAQDVISSLTWRTVATILVAALLLGLAVLIFRRPESPQPDCSEGPPEVVVRYLHKIYGRPGPIGRAWRATDRFVEKVRKRGGLAFDPRQARDRILPLLLLMAGTLYLAFALQTVFWRLVFLFLSAGLVSTLLKAVRRVRGVVDELGRVKPGGPEGAAAVMAPWAALSCAGLSFYFLPWLAEERTRLPLWLVITLALFVPVVQLGRRTAVRIASGDIAERLSDGWLRRSRTLWRRLCRRLFGLDLPREQVHALANVRFTARRGMVGILGPNGAGKTTLLRNLAGILDPSVGSISLGGVQLKRLKRYLARWVGYLPQDFGLPGNLTAREYLDYYALHYEIRPPLERQARVQRLLQEVGLAERADEKIGGFSGGMRQRVAVARTLLRLPPVIIVDEPTVGLDPRERIRFRNLLARLAEGRVVLFSTHVVEDVEVACERVIVFSRGRIVFDGEPARLADEARGRVWIAHLREGEVDLPEEALVVDQIPAGETVRTRILFDNPPCKGAEPAVPSLEDGYLWLVRDVEIA